MNPSKISLWISAVFLLTIIIFFQTTSVSSSRINTLVLSIKKFPKSVCIPSKHSTSEINRKNESELNKMREVVKEYVYELDSLYKSNPTPRLDFYKTIDVRNRLSEQPAFVNYLIVDTLNRALAFEIIKEINAPQFNRNSISKRVKMLQKFRLTLPSLIQLVSYERPKVKGYIDSPIPQRDREIFLDLYMRLDPKSSIMFPKNILQSDSISILNSSKAELQLLLWRLMLTDYMINDLLPQLIVAEENRQKIESIGDLSSILKASGVSENVSFGAEIMGSNQSFHNVYRWLNANEKYIERKLLKISQSNHGLKPELPPNYQGR